MSLQPQCSRLIMAPIANCELCAQSGYCRIPDEKQIFAFLCQKYVQRADARQKAMGLQYTEAETHDLASEIARLFARNMIIERVIT